MEHISVCSVTEKSQELKRTHPPQPMEDLTNKKPRHWLVETPYPIRSVYINKVLGTPICSWNAIPRWLAIPRP